MAQAVSYLIAAQYGSVSDIEVIGTLVAFIGICFSICNIRDAYLDYKALPRTINNGRRAVATLSIRMEAARILILAIYFTLGCFAFTIKDTVNQLNLPTKIVVFTASFRWGLILSGILIMYQSYSNYRVRRMLISSTQSQPSTIIPHLPREPKEPEGE